MSRGRATDKPVVEFGLTDSCCSLAWFNTTNILAAGMNGKYVRLHDTRLSGKQVATSLTRATSGVTVDPSSEHRLAGYGDNQIHIWDTRNFEKPLVSLEQERHVHRWV